MSERPTVNLSVSNWIAIWGIVLAQLAAGFTGGLIAYTHMDRRVTVIETRLDVLSVERSKVTDAIRETLVEIKHDQRELRARIDKVLDDIVRRDGG